MTAAKRKTPISSHPAFKWGVGLWFALLLGLGLFVMPAQVHGLLAERIGLGSAIGDPLVLRAALSLGAALIGLAIGLLLALRVIALNDAVAADDTDPVPAAERDEALQDDDIWLRDPDMTRPTDARQEPRHTQHDDADAFEPRDHGPRVEDAPRRPFNPREDLMEEGIEPEKPQVEKPTPEESADDAAEADEIALFENETVVEGAADTAILAAPEALYDDHGTGADDDQTPPDELSRDSADESVAATEAAEDPLPEPTGDLSLAELTERLRRALDTARAAQLSEAGQGDGEPTIAFLRRESERAPHGGANEDGARDPQAELRSALDKLSRVGQAK